jgi:DNA-binding response OmpR family regulator
MTYKLLIADDARDIAEVIAFAVRLDWPECVVRIATDGQEALRCFAQDQPDLVILDVTMPALDGFEVCQRIRETSPVPILMLTVHARTQDKVRALNLGADDYLTKPFDHLELLARLRALVRRATGQLVPSSTSFIAGDLVLDIPTRTVRVGGKIVHVTTTEYRLLEELVRHAGRVLSHEFLLKQVWGSEYVGDTHYLKVFIRRLRQKLDDTMEHPRYIQTVWGMGYRFVAPLMDKR